MQRQCQVNRAEQGRGQAELSQGVAWHGKVTRRQCEDELNRVLRRRGIEMHCEGSVTRSMERQRQDIAAVGTDSNGNVQRCTAKASDCCATNGKGEAPHSTAQRGKGEVQQCKGKVMQNKTTRGQCNDRLWFAKAWQNISQFCNGIEKQDRAEARRGLAV